jgi:anti-sigma-K factor RskA
MQRALAPRARSVEGVGALVPLWQRLRPLAWQALPAWGAVSLLLVVALAIGDFILWQQVSQAQAKTSSPMRTIALSGTDAAPGAAATLVVGVEGGQGALVVDDLPPLHESREYQLWLLRDGQRTSGGVFSVDRHGYGVLRVSAPRPLREYTSFRVTIEPRGGSPSPTGPRVLGGDR